MTSVCVCDVNDHVVLSFFVQAVDGIRDDCP
jgi:hypothetical protein